MRNQRSNFIPVPTKPAKNTPRVPSRTQLNKKTTCSQTDRIVLIKEENLTFCPCTGYSQSDGGMKRDYIKAVNYINSCHKFINSVVDKNTTSTDAKPFKLPMVTNFVPLFPLLVEKKPKREQDEKKFQKIKPKEKNNDRKSKSSFGVKRPSMEKETPTFNTIPVGDGTQNVFNKKHEQQETQRVDEISDIVKAQISHFFMTLQEGFTKNAPPPKVSPLTANPTYHQPEETPIRYHRVDESPHKYHIVEESPIISRKVEDSPRYQQRVEESPRKEESPRLRRRNEEVLGRHHKKDVEVVTNKRINLKECNALPPPPPLPPVNTIEDKSEECSIIMSDTDCEEVQKSHEMVITTYDSDACSVLSGSSFIKSDSDLECTVKK